MARSRHRLRSCACLFALALVLTAPAYGQGADECAALNGVRYATPDDATTAQYVGVSGACDAADDPTAEVEVVPIGGRDQGPPSSGGESPSRAGAAPTTPATGGGAPTAGRAEEPVAAPPRTSPARTHTTPQEPVAVPDGDADATAEVRVAQALSSADDTRPEYLSAGGLLSPQTGGVVAAALVLVAAGIGLRRRPS